MGNACTKKVPVETPPPAAVAPAGDARGDNKKSTFRERRLSVSQQQNQGSNRRLSVYGGRDSEREEIPSTVVPPMSTCGCKTIAGLEPVPGGSTAKINQDRGLALWPFRGKVDDGLFGVYDGHGRIGQQVSEYVIQTLPGVVTDMMENNGARDAATLPTTMSKPRPRAPESKSEARPASIPTTAPTLTRIYPHPDLSPPPDAKMTSARY